VRKLSSAGLPKRKPTSEAVLRKMAGALHYHACTGCGLRYSCNCEAPARNGRCALCREKHCHPRPIWDRATDPTECCIDNCEQVTDTDLIARYQLAGPGPWFQCRTCKRAHGRLPRSRT
jgi:hypothetical protein